MCHVSRANEKIWDVIENLKAFSSRVTLFFFSRNIRGLCVPCNILYLRRNAKHCRVPSNWCETRVVGKTPSFTSRTYVVDVRRPSRSASRTCRRDVCAAELERSLKVTDAFPKVDTKSDNSISERSTTSPRTELDCRFWSWHPEEAGEAGEAGEETA